MTRKDYILIAAALKDAARSAIEWRSLDVIAGALADALARDNPRFDRERFLKAAGVQS